MFLLKNSHRQRVLIVGVQHRYGFLHDDRAVIEFLIYKMHRAAGHSHTVGECLLLRFESGKCGKQRGMDVENLRWKLLHEPGRKQAHVTGETDEIDFVSRGAPPQLRGRAPRAAYPSMK